MNSGTVMSRQLLNLRHGFVSGIAAAGGRSTTRMNAISSGAISSFYHLCNAPRSAGFHTNCTAYSSYKVPDSLSSPYPQTQLTSPFKKHDHPVSQKLFSAKTTEEIVSVLEQEAELMDVITVSVANEVLFDALKLESGLNVKAKHQLLTSVGVQKLCKLLRRFGPRMDPADLINSVKLLTFMSVPGSHLTFQVLLKLLTKHANSLDLQQLSYVQFLLDKMDRDSKSPLSQALEFALPVVFESQLSQQLDKSDPHAICECLHYATKYKLSDKTVNMLVEAALKVHQRIPTRYLMSLMWSLCDTQAANPSYEPLVTWGFKKIAESIDSYNPTDLNTLTNKAARKFKLGRVPYFYNEYYLDAYLQKYLSSDASQTDVVWSIKHLSSFKHVNIDLVDRIGEVIASNPSYILNDDYLFIVLMRAFANLNYKPEKWSSFSSLLLEHPSLAVTKNFGFSEIMLAVDFLALEMFPDNLIRAIYSADGLPTLEEFQGLQHPIKLLMLYNAVKVLYPEYSGPLPPISMIENWKELSRASNANKQYPLKAALQTGLGGESYVINGLYHDGIHIDHGIVMRKGGYPVAVNSQSDSQSDCVSSITKPPESVMVLIKGMSKDLYLSNTRRLRGLGALELRILESLGNPVVSVDLEKWMELADHEKIPFLMHRIREKMEHLQWNQNWGDVIPP